mgnify:CR=1 FL=1
MHLWLDRRLVSLARGTRLAVIAPRDSAKSTWLSFAWPLFCAVHGLERYILLVAETAAQARRYLRAIRRELLNNPALKRDYPEATGRGEIWNVDRLVLPSGVEIEAIGSGGSVRGRRNDATRPGLVIVDDPQDRKHIVSAVQRNGQWTWFNQDLLNVGSPDTVFLVAGTALHREALVDRLFRQPGWEARRFPAIERWPSEREHWRTWETIYTDLSDPEHKQAAAEYYRRHAEAMNAGAVLNWPQRESLYSLMKLRVDIGQTAFAAEKQGLPINPELCEWPDSYFDESIWFSAWPKNLVVKTLALDPSKGSDARLGDYSAFVRLGIDRAGLIYVDADLRRRPVEEMVSDGVGHYRQFQPDAFGCEANAWQDLLAPDFEAEFARQGLLAIQPWGLRNQEAKLVRIRRLGPFLSGRRLKFLRGSAGAMLLVEQLRDFPLGDHDDGPDALEMALRLAMAALDERPLRTAMRLTNES